MVTDLTWFFEEPDNSLACSSCGLTMKQSEQLSHMDTVISLIHFVHTTSKTPGMEHQIRFICETALHLLGEKMTLTN